MFYFSWLHWKERFLDCARVHITLKTLVIGLISNRRSLFPTFCWEVSGATVFLLWHLQVSFWKASIRLFHSSRKGKNGRPCYLHYLKKMDKYFSWFFLRCICYKAVLMIHKTKLFLTLRVLGYIYKPMNTGPHTTTPAPQSFPWRWDYRQSLDTAECIKLLRKGLHRKSLAGGQRDSQ